MIIKSHTSPTDLNHDYMQVIRETDEDGATIEVVCHPRQGALGFVEISEFAKAQRP